MVVRTKKKLQRKDGMVVRFDDNACALIGKNGEPLGTRINGEFICSFAWGKCSKTLLLVKGVGILTDFFAGVVGSELREKQWSKILSLAAINV